VAERNIRLILQYDGTDFHGWQRQSEVRTVQGELNRAIERILQETVTTEGASRTDAGVHAAGQVANFHTKNDIDTAKLMSALNSVLPDDLSVTDACQVPPEFSSRFSAQGKRYQYLILNAGFGNPLLRRYALHVPDPLNVEDMRAAAARLKGENDYSAFGVKTTAEDNTVCTLEDVSIAHVSWPVSSVHSVRLVRVHVRGDRFLYKMVRTIAGTLVEVGRGRLSPGEIPGIIDSRDRGKAGPTLKPHGLCLVEVVY
jgi:tRNA pseudouridine38-40 synthase